jgi:hypothetical protein
MIRLHAKQNDPRIFKKALDNLLKRKAYHAAAPTKKNEMLREEYARILYKEKELKGGVSYGKKSF